MNALIKKVTSAILILLLMAAVFSGCNAPEATAIAAPVRSLSSQTVQSGNIQLLTTDGATSETTDPEATEPEVTEPEATEPNEQGLFGSLLSNPYVQKFLAFFDWWTAQVNKLFALIKEV